VGSSSLGLARTNYGPASPASFALASHRPSWRASSVVPLGDFAAWSSLKKRPVAPPWISPETSPAIASPARLGSRATSRWVARMNAGISRVRT